MPDFNFMKPKAESIKENARPKPRIFEEFSKNIRRKNRQQKVNKRKINDEELKAVKTKIRNKIAKTNQRKLIFRLAIVTALLIPVYFIGQNFFKSVEEGKQIIEKQREKEYEKRQEYIIKGYRQLQLNNFYEARRYFKGARDIDPDDYPLQLGLTKTHINLCKYYNENCGEAARSLQNLKTEYGNQPGIKKVTEEFMQMQD
jgi:hypothetical protein